MRANAGSRLGVRVAAVALLWLLWPDAQASVAAGSLAVGLALACAVMARRRREPLLSRTLNYWFEAAALLGVAAILLVS